MDTWPADARVFFPPLLPSREKSWERGCSSSQVVHWSAEIQTKVYDPRKDRPIDRSTKRVNSRSLTKLPFRILQNSRKKTFFVSRPIFRAGKTQKVFPTETVEENYPPLPPLPRFFCLSSHFSRGQNTVPRSFFAPKPHGNACYAGYVLSHLGR